MAFIPRPYAAVAASGTASATSAGAFLSARRSRLRDVSAGALAVFAAGFATGCSAFGLDVGAAGCAGAAITAVGFCTAACFGVDAPHAASSSAHAAARPPRTARCAATWLANGFDKGLSDLRFRVASWHQLDERLQALFYPLVVQTFRRARRVRLVQLDGLFLEWERLLFEQYVVLFELVLVQLARSLGRVQVFAQSVVKLGDLVVRGRRDLGDTILGGLAVSRECFFHACLLRLQALVERNHELRALERVARRRRELEL